MTGEGIKLDTEFERTADGRVRAFVVVLAEDDRPSIIVGAPSRDQLEIALEDFDLLHPIDVKTAHKVELSQVLERQVKG